MRRQLIVLAVTCAGFGAPLAIAAGPPATEPVGTVVAPPVKAKGPEALLVVLPDAGLDATGYTALVEGAQRAAADRLRLWVAVGGAGAPTADALPRYEALTALTRAAGFPGLRDSQVVVAGQGAAAPGAVEVALARPVAAVAVLGADPAQAVLDQVGQPLLRLAGEIDRSIRVARLALASAGARRPIVILPAVDAAGLRGIGAGGVLGNFAEATLTKHDNDHASDVIAGSGLATTFAAAARAESGETCAELQHHTADLATADRGLMQVTNRADPKLMDPPLDDPAALPGDLGGFLYDKAELTDQGTTASVVTNSYTLVMPGAGSPATPSGAAEVMCKTKSRSAVAQALYDDYTRVDGSQPDCAQHNASIVAAAAGAVSPEARARFAGVTTEPDDMKRAGPEWVFAPLVLRPADSGGAWSVQAPALLTQLSDTELNPEFAGNHYCKVLSPVRALELVLTDAVRLA
jgi:hypothetical protein